MEVRMLYINTVRDSSKSHLIKKKNSYSLGLQKLGLGLVSNSTI